jgi:hypothetical protein
VQELAAAAVDNCTAALASCEQTLAHKVRKPARGHAGEADAIATTNTVSGARQLSSKSMRQDLDHSACAALSTTGMC